MQVIAISKAQLSEDMAEPAEVGAHAAPAPCRRDCPVRLLRRSMPSAHADACRSETARVQEGAVLRTGDSARVVFEFMQRERNLGEIPAQMWQDPAQMWRRSRCRCGQG